MNANRKCGKICILHGRRGKTNIASRWWPSRRSDQRHTISIFPPQFFLSLLNSRHYLPLIFLMLTILLFSSSSFRECVHDHMLYRYGREHWRRGGYDRSDIPECRGAQWRALDFEATQLFIAEYKYKNRNSRRDTKQWRGGYPGDCGCESDNTKMTAEMVAFGVDVPVPLRWCWNCAPVYCTELYSHF